MGNVNPQPIDIGIDPSVKYSMHIYDGLGVVPKVRQEGRVTQEFQFLNPAIGKGQSSEIRRAISKKTGIMRAIKLIQRSYAPKDEERVFNEVRILEKLDHPNILKINEYYHDERFHYIVTEFHPGGELFTKIEQLKQFTEEQAAKIIFQLLYAVHFCHLHQVVHRDIRPENILFDRASDDAQIILADFGYCCDFTAKMSSNLNHAYYTAPEVYNKKYNQKVDIWAVGVILYILLCGYPPFRGKSDGQIKMATLKNQVEFDDIEWTKTSSGAKTLIYKLLQKDPLLRMSAGQALNDPWFNIIPVTISQAQITRVLNNILTFQSKAKLQLAAFKLIVQFLATREEVSELRQVFTHIDTKRDGYIDQEEFQTILIKQNYNLVDSNYHAERLCSNPMTYTEFLCYSVDRAGLLTKNKVETAFKLIDRDSSGRIKLKELKEGFRLENDNNTDDIWKEIMTQADTNKDTELSLQEFKQMLMELNNNKE